MRTLFWHVRGAGSSKRRRQIKDYIWNEKLDIVGLQETRKHDFLDSELREMCGSLDFEWKWVPSQGLSGGILVGINREKLELEEVILGSFSLLVGLRHRMTNFRWKVGSVYGPVDHEFSNDFLNELTVVCNTSEIPVMLGGDFNLIRDPKDKNNKNINLREMNLFNDFIENCHLKEIKKSGPRFIWTNKQVNHVLVNLDRILVSVSWE